MGVNGRDLKKSHLRPIALLLAALMLTALIPLSIVLVGDGGGPLVVAAGISPALPVTTDDLVCSVDGLKTGDGSATHSYAWYKDGVLQTRLTGRTVDATYTARGERWKCVVTTGGGSGSSTFEAEVVIGNSSPTAPIANVAPDLPRAADNLMCLLTTPSSDADGDPVSYGYAWYKDGELQPQLTGDTVDASNNVRGQVWRCLVTASDGVGGSAGSFDEVAIDSGNTAPSVPGIEISPQQPISNDDLVCSIIAPSLDPDRDPVTYLYNWYKDGILQPQLTGDTVNAGLTGRHEAWRCVVTARDGMGGSAGQFSEVKIQNSPPTVPVVDVTPDVPMLGDDLVCSVTVPSSDADGDILTYTYAWYKNGILQTGLSTSSADASYISDGVTWKCVVTVDDGAGGSASSYDEVGTPLAAKDPGTVSSLLSYGVSWRYFINANDRAHLIRDCQDFGIDTLEAQIDGSVFPNMTTKTADIVAGIQELNAAGIQVWACWNNANGVVGWDSDVYGYTMHDFVDTVLKWNKDHSTAKFTALEFDLEPVTGSTLAQHKTHLEVVYSALQTMRAHVVDGTETIESQGLPVVMFCDPRWGGSVCADALARVVTQLDVVELDYYRWGGGSYPEGIDYSIYYNTNALSIVINLGRYFICALSCDELPKTIEASDPYRSRFSLGRVAYEQAMQDYGDYFSSHHPEKFAGYTTYFDASGFKYWYSIDSVTSWPSGSTTAGDTLTVSYNTYRRTDHYVHRIFGIQMELKDSTGTVVKSNQIIDLTDGDTTSRTISLVVPSGLASGPATVRLTMWAVGYYNEGRYDILWYSDFAGCQEQLLALTMDDLAAMTNGPDGPLEGKRSTFLMLQDTEWVGGITLVGG